MERVTVQYNGEMVTLDVPEGMPDDQIISFLQQQTQQQTSQQITQVPVGLEQPAQQQAALTAIKPATQIAAAQAGDALKLGKIAGQVTPSIMGEFLSKPITSAKNIASAYVQGHPMASTIGNMPLKQMPGAALRTLGAAAMAPENILAAPYTMAGYEMDKIRANPTAPEYEFNPYAQMTRGQAATQGQAGAANRRQAIAGQQYGGLTAEQQQMLEQDKIDQAIRRKAAQKVLGPVIPPGY
jgi:hypothetical protein